MRRRPRWLCGAVIVGQRFWKVHCGCVRLACEDEEDAEEAPSVGLGFHGAGFWSLGGGCLSRRGLVIDPVSVGREGGRQGLRSCVIACASVGLAWTFARRRREWTGTTWVC